jgi:uncharacterized protein (UPF0332 family)
MTRSAAFNIVAWRLRAQQNLCAAMLLIRRTPSLLMPAVSRIYYSCYQAACAEMLAQGVPVGRSHGATWASSHRIRLGLGNRLRDLSRWRLAADYATETITDSEARHLVADYAALARQLGVTEDGR